MTPERLKVLRDDFQEGCRRFVDNCIPECRRYGVPTCVCRILETGQCPRPTAPDNIINELTPRQLPGLCMGTGIDGEADAV